MQRDVGLGALVCRDDLADVGSAEHVAVEHHDVLGGEQIEHIADATTGAQRLVLGHVAKAQIELRAIAVVLREHTRLERGAEYDVGDPCSADSRQHMGEEGQACDGQHRFGRRQRQRAQPCALTADEDHRLGLRHVDVGTGRGSRRGRARHGESGHWSCPLGWVESSSSSIRARPAARTARRERTASPSRRARRSGARSSPWLRSAWNM